MSDIKMYDKAVEELFLQFFITDSELFVRCMGIIDPSHFKDSHNKKTIQFLKDHAENFNTLPTVDQIKAITGKTVEKLSEISDNHREWFLKEFETFCRHREMENVIYSAPDLLEEGRYGEVEQKVKNAVSLGLVKDLGTDYFSDPKKRLEDLRDNSGTISIGLKTIDKKLYGGLNRGEITLFCGQPGTGKSLFLQNIAVYWAEMGLNVVYLSLELSEKLCSLRLDAMVTGYETRDVMRNIDEVDLRVKTFCKKNGGSILIKQLKNGCTANDIKAFVKEYEIQKNIKVDAIVVDYLDLCMPYTVKVSPSDMFVKDKYVTEELRNLAIEKNVLMLSASQLNRSSYESVEFDHSNIAGGLSKINTADNVIAIFTTATMKESGRYQVQFLKTRSSSGVGSKVDLGFNNKNLKIYDLEDDDAGAVATQTANILDKLKNTSTITTSDNAQTILQQTASLRNILKTFNDGPTPE